MRVVDNLTPTPLMIKNLSQLTDFLMARNKNQWNTTLKKTLEIFKQFFLAHIIDMMVLESLIKLLLLCKTMPH